MISVHEDKKKYKRLKCETNFSAQVELVHEIENSHPCQHCGTAFSFEFSLNNHVKKVHEGIRPFTCPHCGKVDSFKSSLKAHIEAVHERKRPYNCLHCETAFSAKTSMRKQGGSFLTPRLTTPRQTWPDIHCHGFLDIERPKIDF